MIRTVLLALAFLGMGFSVQAQEMRRMSKDLDDVTVRARKLSLENLLDSVIKYAPQSYSEPQLLAVTAKTTLYKKDDTLFKALIPAYLVKGPSFTYILKRDTTEKVLVENHLPQEGYKRILNLSAFPEGSNLLTFLEGRAAGSVTRKGFYATSGWGDSLRYHVIIPRSFKRDMLLRLFTTKMDDDTILSFDAYTIRRKGWVLEEALWKASSAPRELVKDFRKTKSYRQADSLMEAARAKEEVPQVLSLKRWREGADGRYFFSDYILHDNLIFFSNSGNPKELLQDYIYSYETHVEEMQAQPDPARLHYFSINDFFKDQSKRAISASFSDRN